MSFLFTCEFVFSRTLIQDVWQKLTFSDFPNHEIFYNSHDVHEKNTSDHPQSSQANEFDLDDLRLSARPPLNFKYKPPRSNLEKGKIKI